MPEQLRRFDWREWREPASPDDPFPEYRTWYMGLCDWLAARRAWAAGHDVPLQQLPREPVPPPGPRPGLLATPEPKPGQAPYTAPIRDESGQGPDPGVNRVTNRAVRGRRIATHG